jgi:hypothetical protein
VPDTGPAEHIRDVADDEPNERLVQDAKALTYETFREHAVLRLRGGRRVLVRGGRYGIDLEQTLANDPFGRAPNQLLLSIGSESLVVERLEFHVHPKPTGPSDDDLRILELLGQDESLLYELFGPSEGTLIRPKNRRGRDVE